MTHRQTLFGRMAVIAFAMLALTMALAGVAAAATLTVSGSMEGALQIKPGDVVSGGYDFTIPGGSGMNTVSFTGGSVSITGPCKGGVDSGKSVTLTINLPDYTTTVNGGGGAWYPSGD